MDPFELLEKVISRDTFFDFLKALEMDKRDEDEKEKIQPSSAYSSGHNGWENGTIANYLEAMWAGSRDNNLPEEPTWRTFAEILYQGKTYE